MTSFILVVLGVTAVATQQASARETAGDSFLEPRQGIVDPGFGLPSPNVLQQQALAGQNPLQQLAFSGQNPLQPLALSGQSPLQQLTLLGQNPLQQLAIMGQNPFLRRPQFPFASGPRAQGLQLPLMQLLRGQGIPSVQLQDLERQRLAGPQLGNLGQVFPGIQQQGVRGQRLLDGVSDRLNGGLGGQFPESFGVQSLPGRRNDQESLTELIQLATLLDEDDLEFGNSTPQRPRRLDRLTNNAILKHDGSNDELSLLLQALRPLPSNSNYGISSAATFPRPLGQRSPLVPSISLIPGGYRGFISRSGQDDQNTAAASDHRGAQPSQSAPYHESTDLISSSPIRVARGRRDSNDQFRFPEIL